MGHGIRHLISLFESLDAIINEADNHLQAEADGQEPPEPTTDEEGDAHEVYLVWCSYLCSQLTTHNLNSSERTYKAYKLLLQLVLQLKEMLEDPHIDTDAFEDFIAQAGLGNVTGFENPRVMPRVFPGYGYGLGILYPPKTRTRAMGTRV
jgi:hypothetical protein